MIKCLQITVFISVAGKYYRIYGHVSACTCKGIYGQIERHFASVSVENTAIVLVLLADEDGAELDIKLCPIGDASGQMMVKFAMFAVPLVFIVLGYVIYLKKYKISEEYYSEILKDLEQR